MAGELAALLMGTNYANAAQDRFTRDKLLAEKAKQQAFDNNLATDTLTRAHPTITEQSSELAGIEPSALEQLILFNKKNTKPELDAEIGLKNAQADYFKSRPDTDLIKAEAAKAATTLKEQGERLPAKTAVDLGDIQSGIQSIDKIGAAIKQKADTLGPIMGRLKALNPWDSDFNEIRGQTDLVRQIVGKALEGGVLRKEDEEKYKKILAEVENDPKSAGLKLQNVKAELQNKYNNQLNSLGSAGYNTGKFSKENISSSPTTPQAVISAPKGATHKVKGSDGQWHYTDGKNDLGVVP